MSARNDLSGSVASGIIFATVHAGDAVTTGLAITGVISDDYRGHLWPIVGLHEAMLPDDPVTHQTGVSDVKR